MLCVFGLVCVCCGHVCTTGGRPTCGIQNGVARGIAPPPRGLFVGSYHIPRACVSIQFRFVSKLQSQLVRQFHMDFTRS